jgi:plastocyanin
MRRALGLRVAVVCLAGAAALPIRAGAPSAVNGRGTAHIGGHPAPNIVVWLDAPNAPKTPQAGKVVLDQRNLAFSPHVLAVRTGTTVDFPNDDRVFHNVFSFRDGKVFDLGLYPVGTMRPVKFDLPGLSRIYCNIHPNMAAYVMAVDTPYVTVSGESGAFTLGSVPPGSYAYHAWRASAPELTGTWSSTAPLVIDWP